MRGKLAGIGLPIAAAGAIAAYLAFGAGTVGEGSSHTSAPKGQAIPTQVLGETLTAATVCPTGHFCISGSATTGIGPATPQVMTLALSNPNSFPIYVTSLGVAGTDVSTNVGNCPGSTTITSPGWAATPASTGLIPTDAIPVAAASSSGYGTATQTVTINWSDSTTADQTPCLHTPSIPVTFSGSAVWYGNCISGSQSGGLIVPPNQVACVSSTGKVTGGITVPSGTGLVLDPGASVTGGVKSSSGATEILFCGAKVTGGVTVTNAAGQIVIGNGTYCPSNSITGGLTLSGNSGGISVVGNSPVTGGMTVTNNANPPGLVSANSISGGLSCSNNSPFSDGGHSNSVSGPRSGQCGGSF